MATSSFLNRWSKRKLEEASAHPNEVTQSNEIKKVSEESQTEDIQAEVTNQSYVLESEPASSKQKNAEEMSIANLLISEASESVKKAALRKLFLSEEFNVRDGLDDYDDDYSNLKSLSEGVADTLRDWIKERPEEESMQEAQAISEENEASLMELSDQDSDENPEHNNRLDKNTVTANDATLASASVSEPLGQNIPHKK